MTTSDLASRRRTYDIPSKPEAGLAEWTSKIKELQRQVDADEEEETKRLEEEIAASRMARMRRSTGRGMSVDLSNTDVAKSLRDSSTTPAPEESRNNGDRYQNQSDALKKLSGDSRAQSTPSYRESRAPSSNVTTTSTPMSLAAFMGGRATGPRLNKHAPQLDSYDATQFDQRPITAPHPVFGRGGVAMPGMTGRGRTFNRDEPEQPTKSSSASLRDRKPSTPSAEAKTTVRSLVQNAEERRRSVVQQQKNGNTPQGDTQYTRQRTLSTPTAPPVVTNAVPSQREGSREQRPREIANRPTTPGQQHNTNNLLVSGRHTPVRSATSAQPSRAHSVSPLPQARSSPPVTSSSPKSPTFSTSPGLARAIQPTPRKSLQGPQVPLSQTSSPSYSRSSPAKDPTPSISRLQGRGFVQNMVRASSQFDPVVSPTSQSPPGDRGRDVPAKKSSVLDRWQFGEGAPPIIAPKPVPLRKTRTAGSSGSSGMPSIPASPTSTPPPKVIKPEHTGKSLRSMASLPSLSHTAISQSSRASTRSEVGGDNHTPASQKRGLGSATTMISYIKPLKTGDNPPTSAPPSRPASAASRSRPASPEVDELGIRRTRTRSIGGGESVHEKQGGGTSGKQLSHPTKERARKPRKAKTSFQVPLKSDVNEPVDMGARREGFPSTSTYPTSKPDNEPSKPLTQSFDKDARSMSADSSEEEVNVNGPGRRVHFPLEVPPSPPRVEKPVVARRHSRIPSTGNRAKVMEVAQALSELEDQERSPVAVSPEPTTYSAHVSSPTEIANIMTGRDATSVASNPPPHNQLDVAAPIALEKRKSSYEKYSAFIMPPLVEEKTPVQTPVGTLTRNAVDQQPPPPPPVAIESTKGRGDLSPEPTTPHDPPSAVAIAVEQQSAQVKEPVKTEEKYIHFKHNDRPIPKVDVVALLNTGDSTYTAPADTVTISVEMLSIQGSTASSVTRDMHIFYDTEILAIVHRSKSKSSGLVNTKVWGWQGNKSTAGQREEKKLQDLARRYNTGLVHVKQYTEPAELVQALGGQLATRQGVRPHWSSENTAMYLVRAFNGVIYIDELELSIKNLCSGYSYCLSLLETFYVWHGCGSTSEERQKALQYAQSIAPAPSSVIELVEGESDEDEVFWLILGEGGYANADYWKWRANSPAKDPRVWQVQADHSGNKLSLLPSVAASSNVHTGVFILDCIWELFVLVGNEARGKREDIRLALSVADELSALAAPSRPFAPTVHALIMPSQLPAEVRLTFRDLDETLLNQGSVPDHLNLVPASLAFEHLQKTSWIKDSLKDSTMLPLGLHEPAL